MLGTDSEDEADRPRCVTQEVPALKRPEGMGDDVFELWKALYERDQTMLYRKEMATILVELLWLPKHVEDDIEWRNLHEGIKAARERTTPFSYAAPKPYRVLGCEFDERAMKVL